MRLWPESKFTNLAKGSNIRLVVQKVRRHEEIMRRTKAVSLAKAWRGERSIEGVMENGRKQDLLYHQSDT